MDYLRSKDERVSIFASFEANYNGPSLDVIERKLVDELSPFNRLTKTSRSMWPDEELIGAEFENDDETIKIKITPSKISIRLSEYSNFDDAYKFLSDRLEASNMDVPSRESFEAEGFTFHCEDDSIGVSYDTTKCADRDFSGCLYRFKDSKFGYSGIQGMVSFSPNGDGTLSIKEVDEFMESVVEDEILIIGSIDEIEMEED